MKPNKVVAILETMKFMIENPNTVEMFIAPKVEALTEAIRCVELLPKLEHCINSCIETGIVDWLDEAKRLIDKAKEKSNVSSAEL